ncbi:MAG: hypothetical protein AAF170_11320 [Bacteroidota bacterium]
MTTRQKVRLGLFLVLGLFLLFPLGDALGWWASDRGVRGEAGYVEIPHGGHVHYVPNDWDGSNLSSFPTTPPPEGMTVDSDGRFVPLSE